MLRGIGALRSSLAMLTLLSATVLFSCSRQSRAQAEERVEGPKDYIITVVIGDVTTREVRMGFNWKHKSKFRAGDFDWEMIVWLRDDDGKGRVYIGLQLEANTFAGVNKKSSNGGALRNIGAPPTAHSTLRKHLNGGEKDGLVMMGIRRANEEAKEARKK